MAGILTGITRTITASYIRFGKIPFLFAMFAVFALYALVNGPAMFPSWENNNTMLIMIYGFMVVIYLIWAKRRTKEEINKPISIAMFSFVSLFFLTWILMICLIKTGLLVPATGFDHNQFWQTLIIQICVVATAEELMFRGVMLDVTKSIWIQAIAFAIWHAYAYQIMFYKLSLENMNWVALVVVFAMGLLLGVIAKNKKFGLPACIGVHACYNLVVLGAMMI